MTKIACLGDSIRMQYTPEVTKILGDGYEIFSPAENCRFAKFTFRSIWEWRNQMKDCRIVHWNNGLWDVCDLFGDGLFSTPEEYVENMLRIADQLLKRHEKVIFATTTPTGILNPLTKTENVIRYNELIVPKLRERGVIINDLFSVVMADRERYIREDHLHLTPEGIEVCAQAVAAAIREAEKTLSGNTEPITSEACQDVVGAPIVI